jgi:predicted enzyme related to lactoylglutathione lyase
MISKSHFVLAVQDLQKSATFYRDVLGFEIHEMGDPGWRFFVSGSCTIMAGECPDAIPVAGTGYHSYFAYLVVDDVDAFHARVAATPTEIVKPLRDEPWEMREFGLRTIDGHRIMIGQEISPPAA